MWLSSKLSGRTLLRRCVVCGLTTGLCQCAWAAVTSAEILAASADWGCFEYRAVGGCLWMTCSSTGCTTSTSIKYGHYTPEIVVTAYASREKHPWREYGAVARRWTTQGGSMARGAGMRGASGNRWKMSEAVGSPGLAWVKGLRMGTTVCDSEVVPLVPYFGSGADPVWRTPEALVPWTLGNLFRRLREPGVSGAVWGAIYPRAGMVVQHNDFRAGAVIAQRAADIVTRRNQWPHVYRRLPSPRETGVWGPPAVREGQPGTHKWQELSPVRRGCERFAERKGRGPASRVSTDGSYAFNLWRPYSCCARRGTFLIGDW